MIFNRMAFIIYCLNVMLHNLYCVNMSDPSGLQEILKTIQLNAYMTFKHDIYGYNEYDRYRSIFNERNIKA